MVGPHPQKSPGGMSSVVLGYRDAGLFERYNCSFIVMHQDGGTGQKFTTAFAGLLGITRALLRGDVALIHIHMASRASFWRKSLVALLAMAARKPYIIHLHGSEFMKFYDDESGPRVQRYVGFIFARAALMLALSEQWRANIARISPKARVEVLPNGVVLPEKKSDAEIAAEGVPQTILFLGRLGVRKGTFDLINAFARIAPEFPDAKLLCAGDGVVDEIKALVNTYGLADRVECTGWLDPAGARRQLARATIFTLPSHAEGLPMALLEAMSWSLPCVTTPVGGIPQAVHDGENGLLVEPGNVDALAAALRRVLADSTLRVRLGQAARRTIEKSYSLEAALTQLFAIYARLGVVARPNSDTKRAHP